MIQQPRVAILGAGILGCCTALELARRGVASVLIDRADEPMTGASRWNEGKIHLGYLYAADPSLATARKLIPGGLQCIALLERLLDQSLDACSTQEDDLFLVHPASVVDNDAFGGYVTAVTALVRDAVSSAGNDAPHHLREVTARRLTRGELAAVAEDGSVVAGYTIPERSLSTVHVAELLATAVRQEPRITFLGQTYLDAVEPDGVGRYRLITQTGPRLDTVGEAPNDLHGQFDIVVNALWEGRLAIDATLGMRPPARWTHRFRAAVYAHAPGLQLRSAALCTGPFGDIKHYADDRVYLSWYPAGLLAEAHDVAPPRDVELLTEAIRAEVASTTFKSLRQYFPGVDDIRTRASSLEVHGGWVFALGQGSLADPDSTLHRRDRVSVQRANGYISVDTAKYSLGPWHASRIARSIIEGTSL